MEPRMTSDGKFICDEDNKTFKTREEYDKHMSEVHLKSTKSKGW